MERNRVIEADTWYEISMHINNREPVFLSQPVREMFERALNETGKRFPFELRDLHIEPDKVTFHIKAADASLLPTIIGRLKQLFALRFNAREERTGHVWTARYGIRSV
jgi:REP element-mobilizing transposase RayT